MVVLASAGGNTVPAIARLVQADEDTIRQVMHRFNEMGMASLDPQWAGGRPRQISPSRARTETVADIRSPTDHYAIYLLRMEHARYNGDSTDGRLGARR